MHPRAVMPPLKSLLKSSEVEDPVNVWVHRPLAYAFAWLVFRTPITPNGVTLFAMIVGIAAGVSFVAGTPAAMLAGGALLWAASILDGADGILARARKAESQFGRALDGTADMVVAVCTVLPAFFHIWTTRGEVVELLAMGPALLLTVAHLYAYDYFKESYLRQTRPGRGGEGDDPEAVARLVAPAREKGILTFVAVKLVLLPFVSAQQKLVDFLVPAAHREGRHTEVTAASAAVYRRHNEGPMRLWAVISLAPHSYLMAICAMLDRLDSYLWIRLLLMNAIFVTVVAWQRRATERTNRELMALGALDGEERGLLDDVTRLPTSGSGRGH
ncbi:MAG: CDP-alcohol phosphatidyltransferase family protein [Polyangiaceae bacterium]|nr:CDP-alcohol phosphatidyltransferase family protein [Polyangiaceae bacterium]